MDLRAEMGSSGGRWTEERHSRFLNLIESTFVHQMLGLHPDGDNLHRCTVAARLDRRVPDCVTGDSAKTSQIRSPPASAADPETRHAAMTMGANTCNYTRKRSRRRYDASLDQVVPEFKNENVGEDVSKQKLEDAAQ